MEAIEPQKFSLPLCLIPPEITRNYKERVQAFYSQGGEMRIGEFTKGIENTFGLKIKRLKWDKTMGLTTIILSASIELNLNGRQYIFHNIEDTNSMGAKAMFAIAEKYLELLK